MLAGVIAAVVTAVLVAEMLRERPSGVRGVWLRIARIVPFGLVAGLSLYGAGRAPNGRKPFQLDLSLSGHDLLRSMSKVPHLRSIAVILLLAALAFGTNHLFRAFVATTLIGVSWELLQTTVVGHHARLADLAPNLVSASATVLALFALRVGCHKLRASRQRKSSAAPNAA